MSDEVVEVEEFSPRDVYPIIAQIMAVDDANDPLLDSYDRPARGEMT